MSTKSLLIIESIPQVGSALNLRLRKEFDITIVASLEEASFQLQSRSFDAVLISSSLPCDPSLAFLAGLQSEHRGLGCVLFTQDASVREIVELLNHPAIFGIVASSMQVRDISKVIRQAIDAGNTQAGQKSEADRQTLGTVALLTELLKKVAPCEHGDSVRAASIAGQVCDKLGGRAKCEVQLAALLAKVGVLAEARVTECEIEDKSRSRSVDHDDPATSGVFGTSAELIGKIPRLDWVAKLVGMLDESAAKENQRHHPRMEQAKQTLQICLEFVKLTREGLSESEALSLIASDTDTFCTNAIAALESIVLCSDAKRMRRIAVNDLRPGMMLAIDVVNESGKVLVARDRIVSPSVLALLHAPKVQRSVREPLFIYDYGEECDTEGVIREQNVLGTAV